MTEAHLRERMEGLFAWLQMNDFRDVLVAKMSTGMRQKVSIARTIVHDPPVLIFDEPTSGLDVLVARVVLQRIAELRDAGKTILFSTHAMHEVQKLCNRVAVIHKGRVQAEGGAGRTPRPVRPARPRRVVLPPRRAGRGRLPDRRGDLRRLPAEVSTDEPRPTRWSNVATIFRREVRDQIRDRRTLFMVFVLPLLLYPILGIGVLQLSTAFEQKPRLVVVVGAENLPESPPLLNPARDGFAASSSPAPRTPSGSRSGSRRRTPPGSAPRRSARRSRAAWPTPW